MNVSAVSESFWLEREKLLPERSGGTRMKAAGTIVIIFKNLPHTHNHPKYDLT